LMEQYIDRLGEVLSLSTVNVLPPEVAKLQAGLEGVGQVVGQTLNKE